ncbi:MAG TPA: hypothetical protein VJ622_06125 [Acidimicrobiia bacterium]|nr:hypothetical protein [Acidimicrobiia bacterium]
MKTWWIGNLLLFLVVVPAVNVLINRTLTAILDIQTHARNILDNVVTLTGKLDEVPELLDETDEVVKQVAAGALRYAAGLDKVAELH